MVSIYNYHEFEEETCNLIIEAVGLSAQDVAEKKNFSKPYEERQLYISKNIAKYLTEGGKYEAAYKQKGLEIFKNPNVTKNKDLRENFATVLAQAINPIIPGVISTIFQSVFMEIHQIGWGEKAKFTIGSNDLFQVNEVAEGIRRQVLQPIFNNEVTVPVKSQEVATSIDWYSVASGKFDWGMWGYRIARSYEGHVMAKGLNAMSSAVTQSGAGYNAPTFSKDNWTKMVEVVSAANGNSRVYALGSVSALGKVLPPALSGATVFVGLEDEYVKKGFLGSYNGATLIPFDNFLIPGTVNSTALRGLPSDRIFFVSADQDKPIKVVFEGDEIVLTDDPTTTNDRTYGLSVKLKYGASAIVGSKFGQMLLA